jgi:hypothetical protein
MGFPRDATQGGLLFPSEIRSVASLAAREPNGNDAAADDDDDCAGVCAWWLFYLVFFFFSFLFFFPPRCGGHQSGQGGRGFERFDAQERALEQLRQFASAKNIHLTLVIHPRKESAEARLSMNSIFGTAKATQEADNVFILQAVPETIAPAPSSGYNNKGSGRAVAAVSGDGDGQLLKFLDVKKNRFTGRLGSIPLHFDERTLAYSQTATTTAATATATTRAESGKTVAFTPVAEAASRSVPATAAAAAPSTAFAAVAALDRNAAAAAAPAVVESVYPAGDDVTVVPLLEEEAFSILTK